jgi:hypothetical protein
MRGALLGTPAPRPDGDSRRTGNKTALQGRV